MSKVSFNFLPLILFSICLANTVYADYLNGKTLFTPNNPPMLSSQLDEKQNKNNQKEKINNFSQLKRSAESGFSPAQHALAIYYLSADKSDISAAVFWLKKAVEQDNVDAMRDLAYLYYQGLGVDKDLQYAKQLLFKPVRQGNTFAKQLFSKIEMELALEDDEHFLKTKNWYDIANKKKVENTPFTAAHIIAWKQAWLAQDIKRYLNFYSKTFKSPKGNFNHWADYKRNIFKHSVNIQISLNDLKIKNKALIIVASFNQHYRSNNYSDKVYKELHWKKEADSKWRIISETTKKQKQNKL